MTTRLIVDRTELLAGAWFTLTQLAERRGDAEVGPTGGWVAGQRLAGTLIAVAVQDRNIVVPAFQITPTGEPRPELTPLLQTLFAAGLDGWTCWAWLTRPHDELDGAVPEQIAVSDGPRAAQAAARFARAHGREPAH